MYKHYIRLDADNFIIYGFSNAFEQPEEGDVCIKENTDRHFEINGEINPSLIGNTGTWRFKYDNGNVVIA